MECSEPGAIRDEELLAYLAGEKVRPFVKQHLTRCQRCTAQLAAYERIERTLTSKLYRFDCPPSQVLGEYQLGLLSKELTAAVNNHLGMCALCAAEVATLTEFLANDQMLTQPAVARDMSAQTSSPNNNHRSAQGAKGILERLQDTANTGARRILATLLPPQPRLAFQRDTTQAALWPRRYTAEDVSIAIQVERDASQRGSVQLIGFVTRQGQSLEMLQGTKVLLILQAADKSLAGTQYTQQIDELGNFVFSAIAPATYTMEVQFPGSNIVIEQLPVTLQD
jgi:anti-sigma factor RsiW